MVIYKNYNLDLNDDRAHSIPFPLVLWNKCKCETTGRPTKIAAFISVTFIGSLNLHMFVFRGSERREGRERTTRYAAHRCEESRAENPTRLEVLSKDQWINTDLLRGPRRIGYLLVSWFNCDSMRAEKIETSYTFVPLSLLFVPFSWCSCCLRSGSIPNWRRKIGIFRCGCRVNLFNFLKLNLTYKYFWLFKIFIHCDSFFSISSEVYINFTQVKYNIYYTIS